MAGGLLGAGGLGDWEARVLNTVYQAATDGIVVAHLRDDESDSDACSILGYTDSSNPPTTLRARDEGDRLADVDWASITFPVKKGDYWKVARDDSADTPKVYWIPLNSGGGSDSLWTSGVGDNIYRVDGSVGIGMTNPWGGPLTVFGATSVDDAFRIMSDTDGEYMNFWKTDSPDAGYIQVGDADDWRTLVLQPHGGNVGIGTTEPSGGLKFDVEGKIGATEYCDENGVNCVAASEFGSASTNYAWMSMGCGSSAAYCPSCPSGWNLYATSSAISPLSGGTGYVRTCYKEF